MAVTSLIVVILVALVGSMFGLGAGRPSVWVIIAAPVFYLVFTYVSIAIGRALYNVLVPFIGGLEYEPTTPVN